MTKNTKNVFISHIHKDDDGLGNLKDLVSKNGMTIRDYSITADKPNQAKSEEYIKSAILGPKIKQCKTMVVYITPETKNSEWVNWEIEYAQKNDIRIVGVWAEGDKGCEIPDALNKYHDAIVGWTGNSIIDAINGKIDGWKNPNGSDCEPRDIRRYSCG